MLQNYQYPQDPTITKNEDYCGKCTSYSPHILRGIIGFFSAWQQLFCQMNIFVYFCSVKKMI